MDTPLISVIVPIYNVESYIRKCIDSIRMQSYQNLEILLVDDGSTDSSGRICDWYMEQDSRIIVIHKNNGGLSSARNAALDVMTGDYVVCIDSDDYVAEDYIEYLYTLLVDNDADVSACQLKKIYDEDEQLDIINENVVVLDKINAIENYLYQRVFSASAHCKLYKRYIFETLRYPEGYYYEDMAIICQILDMVECITISNTQKYYYVQRDDSIMGERFNPRKLQRIEIAENIRGYIGKHYPLLISAANSRCFLASIQTYREIPFGKQNEEYISCVWEKIAKYRFCVLKDRKSKVSLKVMALASFLGRRVMAWLGNLYSICA